MDQHITRIDRIKVEARQAAARYSDVNAACPYPFGSPTASTFAAEFNLAREQLLSEQDDDTAAADELPYCACNAQPTIEECEWNKCGCCGKPFHL